MLEYAQADSGDAGIVFEIQMGMIDRGASLGWLSQVPRRSRGGRAAVAWWSRGGRVAGCLPDADAACPPPPQYPQEEEILFAPLTGLEIITSRVVETVLLVEVRRLRRHATACNGM